MRKLVIVFVLFFLTAGCQSEETYRETRFLFDTEVYIETHGSDAEKDGKKAVEKMAAIDQSTNFFSVKSEISKINKAAGIKPVSLSKEMSELLEYSLEIAELTNTAYDPTIGPLVQLWQTAKTKGSLPPSKKIESLLPLVDYKKVALDSKKGQPIF